MGQTTRYYQARTALEGFAVNHLEDQQDYSTASLDGFRVPQVFSRSGQHLSKDFVVNHFDASRTDDGPELFRVKPGKG